MNSSALIVDDSEADVYLLKRMLKKTEFFSQIFVAGNGAEGLEFFLEYERNRMENPKTFPPMVILLDINMPVLTGHEFLQQFAELRGQYQIDTAVILMITSSDLQTDRNKASSYDFVKGFISKMPSPEELHNEIRAALPA